MVTTVSITDLPEAAQPLRGDEQFALVQPGNATDGVTKRISVAQFRGLQSGRQQQTASTTFYFSSSGTFNNNGLSTTAPWPGNDLMTAQQLISQHYDFAGQDCNLSFASGTYTDITPTVTWGSFQFLGATSVKLTSTSGTASAVNLVSNHTLEYPLIPNLSFDTIGITGSLTAQAQSQMLVNNIFWRTPSGGHCGVFANFGNIAWFGEQRFFAPGTIAMSAAGGILQIQIDYLVADGGVIVPYDTGFGVAKDRGMIYGFSFSTFQDNGASWVGQRFVCKDGGLMDIGLGAGYTYFPGTIDGTIASGGTYIG